MFEGVVGGPSWPGAPTIPFALFAMYQLKFAIITPALITGAFAERIRFKSYVLFLVLFFVFIYAPLAHATWHPDGLLASMGVLDFARSEERRGGKECVRTFRYGWSPFH